MEITVVCRDGGAGISMEGKWMKEDKVAKEIK